MYGSYIAAACFDDGNIVQWTMPMLMLLTMITPVLLMLESLQFNRVTANSEASCSPYAAATVLKTIVFMFLFGIFVFLLCICVFLYFSPPYATTVFNALQIFKSLKTFTC